MEGIVKIKRGTLYTFSAQQLVDCTGVRYRNSGCTGGYMTNCFNYLTTNKIMTE